MPRRCKAGRYTCRYLLCVALLIVYNAYGQALTVVVNGSVLPVSGWVSNQQSLIPSQENTLQIDLILRGNASGYSYRFWQNREGTWQPVETTTRLCYHNLSGDEYQFEVRRNTQLVVRHRFLVDNALWQRWWFAPSLFGYGLFVFGVLMYLFYRYRIRQFLRMQQVRDRIARDLHDDMGSYLSSISIMSEMGQRNALRDPEKTGKTLEKIGQIARQIMDSMSDMVWSINPSHDSMTHVITRMTDVGNNLFADTAIDFQLQVGQDVGTFPLTADARRDLYLIYKEALTNATRYAGASRVRAALQRTQTGLTLSIQDNGRGFNTQHPDYQNPGGGNGIRNMQTRASLLGAQLAITSGIGEGTSIHLIMPAGAAGG